jgi:hypothetical protein
MERRPTRRELEIRGRLGIPVDARQVILFTESSHWDPDWLLTSQQYYNRYVKKNLDSALAALAREPARVYSIECIFFLRMYWERNPRQRSRIRQMVNSGRLRLTSSGITTADSLVPRPEAILRDLLAGQEWLRRQGMIQEPRLAYFTDSFGLSPGLPSLLKAGGFDWTAFTRIDGMLMAGCDALPASRFPFSGSSAERLLKKERSLDLIWRDPNGAEVLAHWNAFNYGQGDMLAFSGVSRVYLFPMAFPNRSRAHVRRMIATYAGQLFPLARTPYTLCPLGFDFVGPTPRLTELLERYNQLDYPSTGIWVVNAGMDDYFSLLEEYRQDLPLVEMDLLPYWTGFYTSRPALKHVCHQTIARLQALETEILMEKSHDQDTRISQVEDLWQDALVSNHHDFITGTAPDKVVEAEQVPLLQNILVRSQSLAKDQDVKRKIAAPKVTKQILPVWDRRGGRIVVRARNFTAEFDEDMGGCLTTVHGIGNGSGFLEPGSADLVLVRESGGLWRMGNELAGGIFREVDLASHHPIQLEVSVDGDELKIRSEHFLGGEKIIRTYHIRIDEERILVSVQGRAPRKHTLLLRWRLKKPPASLIMENPGALIERPNQRHYQPTYWPVQRLFVTRDRHGKRGVAFHFQEPGAAAVTASGDVDLVALRNAEIERYYGWLPVPGQPASGHEKETFTALFGIHPLAAGEMTLGHLARLAQAEFWSGSDGKSTASAIRRLLRCSTNGVEIIALKPASRGQGWIARLMALAAPQGNFSLSTVEKRIERAWLCDGRERDLMPLPVQAGKLRLQMKAAFATIRLIVK